MGMSHLKIEKKWIHLQEELAEHNCRISSTSWLVEHSMKYATTRTHFAIQTNHPWFLLQSTHIFI